MTWAGARVVLISVATALGALTLAGPASAAVARPTIASVVFTGSPDAPVVTIHGSGFGAQPAASPSSGPCIDEPDQGFDYGNSIYLKSTKAALGWFKAWSAGRYIAGQELDCIGLRVSTWTANEISFSFGDYYDNFNFALSEGDPVVLSVGGRSLSTVVHYAGGPPQLPTESWCDPDEFTCASGYIHLGSTTGNLVQKVTARHLGGSSFAALAWDGGYIGIQNDGNSVSGQVGPTAVFSLGGTGVQISSTRGVQNANCETGFDTGAGASCRVALPSPIVDGTTYKYTVSRASTGWITGKVTTPAGVVVKIGTLRPGAGAGTTFTGVTDFIEYFGDAVAAVTDVPQSVVEFAVPVAKARAITASRLLGACASVANNGKASPVLTLGGGGCTST
jgi:hypothetical protein